MKKYTLFILLILSLTGNCQAPENVFRKILPNNIFCRFQFLKPDGTQCFFFGGGLIIDSEYILTCYHLSKPKIPVVKLLHINIFYNLEFDKGKLAYDTTSAYVDPKPLKGQYDFSKHIYDTADYRTDILVLKLNKKILSKGLEIPDYVLNQYDHLYAFGLTANSQGNSKAINGDSALLTYLFPYLFPNSKDAFWFAYFGNAHKGFSGSPVYNPKGQILGIIQFGWDELSTELDQIYSQKIITKEVYGKILEGYKHKDKVGFAIGFDYVFNKYLKGYIKNHTNSSSPP